MDSIAYVTNIASREELEMTWRVDKKIRFVDLVGKTSKRKRSMSYDMQFRIVDQENKKLKDALRQFDPNHPLLKEKSAPNLPWGIESNEKSRSEV